MHYTFSWLTEPKGTAINIWGLWNCVQIKKGSSHWYVRKCSKDSQWCCPSYNTVQMVSALQAHTVSGHKHMVHVFWYGTSCCLMNSCLVQGNWEFPVGFCYFILHYDFILYCFLVPDARHVNLHNINKKTYICHSNKFDNGSQLLDYQLASCNRQTGTMHNPTDLHYTPPFYNWHVLILLLPLSPVLTVQRTSALKIRQI